MQPPMRPPMHPNRSPRSSLCSRLVIILALAGTSASAWGQNALGDGRQLDGSLSTASRFNPKRADATAEYRFRNAMATGNAPGGMSLRADVGYRSAFEFRGELGSDDLFSFRRDSLYSGLAGMGIRGTDAIQYQFAMTTGSRLPQNLLGPGTVSRDGSGPNAASRGYNATDPVRRPTDEERLESERLTGMLRSPSSYATTRSLRPVYLGSVADLSGEVTEQGVSASALRGIRIIELGSSRGSTQGEQQRVHTAYDTIMESLRVKTQLSNEVSTQQDEPGEAPRDWRSRLNELRDQMLRGAAPGQTPANPDEETPDGEGPDEADPEASSEGRPVHRFDPETIRILRPTGPPIETLVDPDSPMSSVYLSHMETGQHLLSVGRYFDAEERFTRALSMRPGDVSAQVGRLHSQLGAGLFISAGLNLRELMMTSPEVAATRFAIELLPAEGRAEELVIMLRERAGLVEGRLSTDLALQRETSLLLAYLSYQRGDGAGVVVGLGSARETLSEEELTTDGGDVRLIEYLTQVWSPAEPEGE